MQGSTGGKESLYRNLTMKRSGGLVIKLGLWASVLLLMLQVYNCIYDLFAGLFIAAGTDIATAAQYAAYYRTSLSSVVMANAFINIMIPILYLVLAVSIHYLASEDRKALTFLNVAISAAFMVLASASNFINATFVHWAFLNGGDEFVTWAYNVMLATMTLEWLTWGFFLGISYLLMAQVFRGDDLLEVVLLVLLTLLGSCRILWFVLSVLGVLSDITWIGNIIIVYGTLFLFALLIYYYSKQHRQIVAGISH